jgi:RHH-type transcriptional regulator, proline utilization regulon repressor / proline dehydrogenase / delta 1-pyrroline-5-carboxylate dehydrogenase
MASNLERDVQAIGREIFAKMEDRSPSVFQRNFWSGKLLDVCMKDEAFKLEMFRFVDVFPVLRGADEVSRHVREYFSREGQSFGFLGAALGLAGSGLGARIGAAVLEKNILSMARRFIAGERLEELRPVLMELRKGGLAFTVDLLGEATCSEAEAETYARRYMELLEGLSALTQSWPADERLDTDAYGPIPRVNVSIKVSALFSQMDAIAPERSLEALTARARSARS